MYLYLDNYISTLSNIDVYIEIAYSVYIKNIKYKTDYSIICINNEKINNKEIEIIRKRTSIPATNETCIDYLYKYKQHNVLN